MARLPRSSSHQLGVSGVFWALLLPALLRYFIPTITSLLSSVFLLLLQPLNESSAVCSNIVRSVVEEGQALVLRDCAAYPLAAKYAASRGTNAPGSLMCVPIIYKGTTMGK